MIKTGFIYTFLTILCINQPITGSIRINSIEDAIDYAIKFNPELSKEQRIIESKQAIKKGLGTFDSPTVGVRLNGFPAKQSSYSMDQQRYIINQRFPFFGTLARQKKLGEKDLELAIIAFKIKKNALILSIKKTYFNLILNEKLKKITEKNHTLLNQIIHSAEAKYQSQKLLQANVLTAKISQGKLNTQLLELSHKKNVLIASLKRHLGLSIEDNNLQLNLNYPSKKEGLLAEPSAKLINSSLLVKEAITLRNKAALYSLIQKDLYLPHFNAQFEFWNNSGSKNQYATQILMSLPWFNKKNTAKFNESQALSHAKEDLIKHQQNIITEQLRTWVSELDTTSKILTIYDTQLLQNARLAVSNYQQSFEVDQVSFFEYLKSEQSLYRLETEHAHLVNKKHLLEAQIQSLF